jgi:2-methylcitrate dehydratase PrpD
VQQAVAALNFGPNDLKAMHVGAPPLTYRLVGRPDIPNPKPNYARLCIPYVVAATLSHGTCTPASFAPQHLSDPALHALASKVQVSLNTNPDVNALWPQQIRIELHDGRVWEKEILTPIGHPENPLSDAACQTKFQQCWDIAGMPQAQGDALLDLIQRLESVDDVSALTRCLVHQA